MQHNTHRCATPTTGKNVCFLSASASRAAIHNSFAKRENLADITAKAGSQFIVTSILGARSVVKEGEAGQTR